MLAQRYRVGRTLWFDSYGESQKVSTMVEEVSTPTIDELQAKSARLVGDVDTAEKALTVAKKTFADAASNDPTAVESLLELATAVKAAEKAVTDAQRAVTGNQTAIAGIEYDKRMGGVTEATLSLVEAIRIAVLEWRTASIDGVAVLDTMADANVTGMVATIGGIDTETVTVGCKPTGDAMPQRPSTRRTGDGTRGSRGSRTVTVDGNAMSCREYVASCGTDASPAAQADLAGTWDGSPVSYTNEAKRLAAKRGDTFA